MKYFVIADVHGFYDEMMAALDEAGFDKNNPNHTLISLGDVMDRGSKPKECLEFLLELKNKVLICGNHEDLMEDAIASQNFQWYDYSNGAVNTAMSLTGEKNEIVALMMMKSNSLYNKYISECVDYFETAGAIFVHGWIPCVFNKNTKKYSFAPDWKNASIAEWKQARWVNGMDAWQNGIKVEGKTIFCGHWHTSWGHCHIDHTSLEFPNKYSTNPAHQVANFDPFIHEGIVALDACTAFSHKVNCYVWEDEPIKELT